MFCLLLVYEKNKSVVVCRWSIRIPLKASLSNNFRQFHENPQGIQNFETGLQLMYFAFE
jgi:hypothetical protein